VLEIIRSIHTQNGLSEGEELEEKLEAYRLFQQNTQSSIPEEAVVVDERVIDDFVSTEYMERNAAAPVEKSHWSITIKERH
jgi:hypothetical protein